jgi:phosphatidylinositol glycan class O
VYFFTKGFLLTRLVLDEKSECGVPPIRIEYHAGKSYEDGCWYPKTFDRAVIIIIDALRYDFTVPIDDKAPEHFHNALTILHETSVLNPENAFLLPFIADPPTTTLQRLKGLTTGTLPTFVDAGSNFAGTAIEEDNLLAQMRDGGKTLVHLGDDTWHALFPGYFDANLTHAYESLNVWDLHTVDDGVTEHLLPLLRASEVPGWDIIIGHFLGVDHVGHQYGPNHPIMTSKLKQMDRVLREIIASLDRDALLVVMGDHGMDAKGDHGGESEDEVEAALWMFSKKGIFGREQESFARPPTTAKERPIRQIDLVPTLSLLLGLPIPFNNLGAPIAEAFIGSRRPNWQNLATAFALTAAQIQRYQHQYSAARKLDKGLFAGALDLWREVHHHWAETRENSGPSHEYRKLFAEFSKYQKQTLQIFKTLWAIFDLTAMLQGIMILFSTIIVLVQYARSSTINMVESTPAYLRNAAVFSVSGSIIRAVEAKSRSRPMFDNCLTGFAWGGIFGCMLVSARTYKSRVSHKSLTYRASPKSVGETGSQRKNSVVRVSPSMQKLWGLVSCLMPIPNSAWGWLSFVFTLSQAVGFASNSYTIWEDEILLFFLSTFSAFGIFSSLRQGQVADRARGMKHCAVFLLLTRLASVSRLCREEQMPSCRSTYYASSTSSTSAPWQVAIPFSLAIFLPDLIELYHISTHSYRASAVFWFGFGFRLGLLGPALFWTVDAAETSGWINIDTNVIKIVKTSLAQFVLAVACAAGTSTFIWAKPCVSVDVPAPPIKPTKPSEPTSPIVHEYGNARGARYFILVASWALAIILLQKPMGGGVIGILLLQILALLEIIQVNNLSRAAIGPVVLALLGSFHFFKTGHQATLSSIQWESAFIPLKTIIYPWSPLFVVLNTFGAQILTAIAVPLTVLWKQPPRKRLLVAVVRAVATHILYYAVINLATTMWAGWLRRHLMLYRVFSPRFLTGTAVLFVLDLVAVFVALPGVGWISSA